MSISHNPASQQDSFLYSAVFPLISFYLSLSNHLSHTGVKGHWGKGEGTEQLLEPVGYGSCISIHFY